MKKIYPAFTLLFFMSVTVFAATPFSLTRKIKDFDRADLEKPVDRKSKQPITKNHGYVEYDVQVPATGWYTFELGKRNATVRYEFYVDGQEVTSWSVRGESLKGKKFASLTNIFLTSGKHTLRLERMGFPNHFPFEWRLRASNLPEHLVRGRIVSKDVIRAGEKLVIEISGGGAMPLDYAVKIRKAREKIWQQVASVKFPAASKPLVKQFSIPCNDGGTFSIRLFHNGKMLPPSTLQAESFAVIDTKPELGKSEQLKTRLIHSIDCVKLQIDGKPLKKDVSFWEAGGSSRVATSSAGTYRESAPSGLLPKAKDVKLRKWGSVTGMAYAFTVPQLQKPYLAEVVFPDDDRRTVVAGIIGDSSRRTSAHGYHHGNSHAGYETGDWYALSNKMKNLRIFFYPANRDLRMQLVSFGDGLRAAAAKINIYEVVGGFPAGPPSRPDGRQLINWFEEMYRWRKYFRTTLMWNNGYEKDYVGLKRWLEFARYLGYTGVSPTELIYGGIAWRSKQYNFFYDNHYNASRIDVLLCEKYNMKYIPQFHVRHPHSWFETRKMGYPANAIYDRFGNPGGGMAYRPRYNPLHPATQKYYLGLIKELCDLVGDSPAFGGFSFRVSVWYNNSWHAFPGLNWGYGDWMISEFEKDTGIKVPGTGKRRFIKRFRFLCGNPANRKKWLDWRNKRMLEFYKKIRDLVRSYQPDATVYLDGEMYSKTNTLDRRKSFAKNEREGMLEVGIDVDQLKKIPGITYLPRYRFNRAKSYSRATDQEYMLSLLEPDHIALGKSASGRVFKISNGYFEPHSAVPVTKLGLTKSKKYSFFASAQAAGRNMLEKLAIPLAEQDISLFIEGGAQYMFLQDDICREWLTAYKQLPALPFERSKTMSDPVALWSRTCDDGFYFYLVNRENYPVKCFVTFKNCKELTKLASKDIIKLNDGRLQITLQPFGLQSYKAVDRTKIVETDAVIPADKLKLLESQIAFCDKLAKTLNNLPESERNAFLIRLNKSKKSFALKHYWRARVELMYPEMITVFEKTGKFPQGQFHRKN